MGNIITKKIEIPLPENYPCPVRRPSDYTEHQGVYFRGAEICYESYEQNKKGIVLYFHGSGGGPTRQYALSDAINDLGYTYIGINELGHGDSGPLTYRTGYGNVNNPEFQNRWIKTAWWIKTVMDYLKPRLESTGEKVVILGHSMGATGTIAYLAGYADFDEVGVDTHVDKYKDYLKGVMVNGATIGGLGTFSWNDVNRNINGMSQMLRLAQYAKVRMLITYSDNDSYAPPDYVKRLQLALQKDDLTYLVSSGDRGHAWTGKSRENADIAASWVDSLMTDKPILLLNGKPATPIP